MTGAPGSMDLAPTGTAPYPAPGTQHAPGTEHSALGVCQQCDTFLTVRVLMDYRPALRKRSGVGEYAYQLARALISAFPSGTSGRRPLDLTLFSSSWKDRFDHDEDIVGATVVDRRVPVSLLNLTWHRLEWPPAETLTGARFDVAHSPHPLILPSKSAARVITIHDLYFLTHPERAGGEVRRDYPALARAHAHRADHIIVPSKFTAIEVENRLEVPSERISVCPHGRPNWVRRPKSRPTNGYVLFLGTLEPRKNVGGLLDAYERLASRFQRRRRQPPELVVAGRATRAARPLLERIARPPLQNLVRYVGYVDPMRRQELYEGARLLVQPSFEEGFGFPVLEAMTLGIPVVAANRGSLPELLDEAGILVEPDDADHLAAGIEQMLDDEALAETCAAEGIARSSLFDWQRTAHRVFDAYQLAIDHRRQCASV